MPLMLGALYDALRAANVPDDIARKAAEEVASYEGRLAGIESDARLLKWMVGTHIALTVAGFGLLARLVVSIS